MSYQECWECHSHSSHITSHTSPLLTSHLTPPSSQHYFLSHHLSQPYHTTLITPLVTAISHSTHQLAFVWQAQYTEPSGRAAARVVAAWPSAGFRVAGAAHRQSLLEELLRARVVAAWPAAGFRVAGAAHRAFWRSCGVRGCRLARGWLSCGRRSTQSLLEELRRAWSPPGPRLAFVRQAQHTELSGGAAAWPPPGPRLAFAWQAQHTEPSGGAAAWSPPGARLAFVWQAQHTEPAGGAAAWSSAGFRVAGAAHGAFWRSCGARGRRLARGWLSCGRRSTESLLEELRRARSPPGPRLAFVRQAQHTEPSGGAAARVVAAWPAAGFRAGAVHRAFWRSCGARGRRLARGWLSCGRRSTQSLLEELRRAWLPPGLRLAFVWQTGFCGKGAPSFTHHFVTNHLWHTTLSHTIHMWRLLLCDVYCGVLVYPFDSIHSYIHIYMYTVYIYASNTGAEYRNQHLYI